TTTSGTLTFGPGVVSQVFSVPIINDNHPDPNLTVNLKLSAPTGGATLGTPNTAVLTIIDGNQPGTLQFSTAGYTVGEGNGQAQIIVTRTGGSTGTVTVRFATSNGTARAGVNYTTVSGTLSFGPGVISQVFNVPIIDDNHADPNL